MRATPCLILCLAGASSAWAQTAIPIQTTAQATRTPFLEPTSGRAAAPEQRTERIHIEDASSSIDELRIGGETRTIAVQPKGGMPAYQVQPGSGERSWKVLDF